MKKLSFTFEFLYIKVNVFLTFIFKFFLLFSRLRGTRGRLECCHPHCCLIISFMMCQEEKVFEHFSRLRRKKHGPTCMLVFLVQLKNKCSFKLRKRNTLIKVTQSDESRSRRGVNYSITGEQLEALTIPVPL